MAILMQGLVLLIAGMGIVFAFLAVLVYIMSAASKIVPKFNHILPDEKPKKRQTNKAASLQDDTAIAIAIAAATAQTA